MTAAILQSLYEDQADMTRLLGAFEHQLAIFEQAGSPDYDLIDGVVDYCLTYLDLYCHPKEELILSTLLLHDPDRTAAVDELREQHRELGALTRRLAAAVRHLRLDATLSREAFSGLAREVLVLYRRHMDAEAHLLFDAAPRTLTPEDWMEIDDRAARSSNAMSGFETGRLELLRAGVLAGDASA